MMHYRNFFFIVCLAGTALHAANSPIVAPMNALNEAITNLNDNTSYQFLTNYIRQGLTEYDKVVLADALHDWATTLKNNRDSNMRAYYHAYALSLIPTLIGYINSQLIHKLELFEHADYVTGYKKLHRYNSTVLLGFLSAEAYAAVKGFLTDRNYILTNGDEQLKRVENLLHMLAE